VEEGPEVTSAKLEETKSNEKDIKNCFEFENFETPDSIDFSGDSIEKTKVKMVSDSKSVANTDEQAGQALQLTIVLIYLNNNTRGKMLKNLNARMDGGDLLTLKGAETEARLLGEKLYSNQEDCPNCDMIQCYADFASPDGVEQDKQISSDITDKEDEAENSKSISSPVLVQNMSVLYHQAGQCGPVVLREDPC
jgi:glutaredoxin